MEQEVSKKFEDKIKQNYLKAGKKLSCKMGSQKKASQPGSHGRKMRDAEDNMEVLLDCGSARWLAGSKAPSPPAEC